MEDSERFSAIETNAAALGVRVDSLEKGAVKTETALVEMAKKVDDLTTSQKLQLDILNRLDALAANPSVKIILAIIATVLTSWAAAKGLK